MIRRPFIKILLVVLLGLSLTGCEAYKQAFKRFRQKKQREEAMEQEAVIDKVESLDLAKIILSPRQYQVDIDKDPFRPLLQDSQWDQPVDEETGLESAKYLGLVKIGDRYSALLQVGQIKGAFAVNESVGTFVVIHIEEDFVELKKDDKTFQLKRGAK